MLTHQHYPILCPIYTSGQVLHGMQYTTLALLSDGKCPLDEKAKITYIPEADFSETSQFSLAPKHVPMPQIVAAAGTWS